MSLRNVWLMRLRRWHREEVHSHHARASVDAQNRRQFADQTFATIESLFGHLQQQFSLIGDSDVGDSYFDRTIGSTSLAHQFQDFGEGFAARACLSHWDDDPFFHADDKDNGEF